MLIETERLGLRPITMADLDEFVAVHADAEVTRFIGAVDTAKGAQRLRANLDQWQQRGHGMFAIVDRQRERFHGTVGLEYWPQFDETEVGWVLRRNAWGRGFATEAARACAAWGFDHLEAPYLTTMIKPENQRSIAVAQRIGMSPLRPDVLLGDAMTVYSIAREQWEHAANPGGPR